jgi:hypothetical protein
MKDLKIRASQVGKLMTASRSKGEVLSQTAKTYIQELALENLYGIRKEFNSRYTDKGNLVEDESIQLAASVLDLEFVFKNEEYFSNDYIKGTPDVVGSNFILDVKSSWTGSTFPFFETECPNKDYYYQLMAYLWLTGKDTAILAYCLVNTPEDIVLDEIRRASWIKKELEISEATEAEVRRQHEFDHIPNERRVKAFLIEKDEQVIEQMKDKIEQAREYYNQIIQTL